MPFKSGEISRVCYEVVWKGRLTSTSSKSRSLIFSTFASLLFALVLFHFGWALIITFPLLFPSLPLLPLLFFLVSCLRSNSRKAKEME